MSSFCGLARVHVDPVTAGKDHSWCNLRSRQCLQQPVVTYSAHLVSLRMQLPDVPRIKPKLGQARQARLVTGAHASMS